MTPARARVCLVMGVSGSGKSTLARHIATATGAAFVEADDLHPPANIAAMRAGQPLTDAMRAPWLDLVARAVAAERGQVVLACSALKRAYRDRLRDSVGPMATIFLTGEATLLAARIAARPGHFMPAALLPSQIATLESPAPDEGALTLSAALLPDDLLKQALAWLGWPSGGERGAQNL